MMSKKKEQSVDLIRILKKVQLNGNKSLTVIWEDHYKDEAGVDQVRLRSSTNPERVHDDLLEAWKPLAEHLGMITEYLSPKKGVRPPFDGTLTGADAFTVKAVTMSGDEGDRAFITGRKRLKSGRPVNFVTPGILIGNPQEPYEFAVELESHLDVIKDEVWAYVLEGKHTPNAQTSITDQTSIEDEGSTEGDE